MTQLMCRNGHPQVKATARFCYLCGAQMVAPVEGSAVNGVCSNGHAQVRAGANFCYLCRAPISLRPDPANGVCVNGHPQMRMGAKFCYQCRQPVALQATGPLINGRYQIAGEIGRGGMGSVVYRVLDSATGKTYALKEIDETQLQPVSDRPEIIRAFQREAELLQRLDHPNIVKVYDSFQLGIKHYMVMDLVQGKMLEDLLTASPGGFPEARMLPWAVQLCDALDYLHHQTPPIIYRDMKPANAMIADRSGQITLLDFGIAREFKGGKKKSDTIKFGTDGYAPPEQYGKKGVETSPASDVYALGAMLHQLLTGKDPAQNPFTFDFLILSRPPVLASPRMIDALKKALDMDVSKRFQTMAEFSTALTGQQSPARQAAPKKVGSPAVNNPPGASAGPQVLPSCAAGAVPAANSVLPPMPSTTGSAVQVSVSQLDFGKVEKGGEAPPKKIFTATLAHGGRAQITPSDPWLVPMPSTVTSGGLVEVSIEAGKLPLGKPQWTLPNILRFTVDQLKRLPGPVWWLVGLMLLVGIQLRAIWQVAVILIMGWLGLQLVTWSIGQLLPYLAAYAADHSGLLTVSDGSTSQTITVHVTAMPSLWRKTMGWLTLLAVVLGEAGAALVAGWFLFQTLGG